MGALADREALQRTITGDVRTPGSPDYQLVRKPAIAAFTTWDRKRSSAARRPTDVATTIAFARWMGSDVAVRCGGHCFAGRSSTHGIVIDV